ncbi:hypothetical protein RJ640_003547 [Escallonia rubra]|uniref:Uncharacterized protein n=1 Tax=Escallonia rubra TaxID=112253 RepID=A0AA88UI34_9ASTE|nr:hypothetical protein RJ640_003547 [Escallonia rubra]
MELVLVPIHARLDRSTSCDLAKKPTRRSRLALQTRNANSTDLESISTSSSQISTARVRIDRRGRNRELRLADFWRITETGASPPERLRESCVKVSAGVEGFPQRTSTAATDGEAE